MATSIPPNPTSQHIRALTPKLASEDADIRFMTLNDINQILTTGSSSILTHDQSTCTGLITALVKALNDNHGEVQNQAIKVLSPFVNKAPDVIHRHLIDAVAGLQPTSDITLPALALRTIVLALPQPVVGTARTKSVAEAYTTVTHVLLPRLLGQVPNKPKGLLEQDVERGEDSNSLDVLIDVVRAFGPMLQEQEVVAIQHAIMQTLSSDTCSPVMRKKAVTALSVLAPYFSDKLLAHLVSTSIEELRQTHLTNQQRKVYLSIYGSLARSIPHKFGPFLEILAPFALSPLSQLELEQQRQGEEESGERDAEFEEVREVALAVVETFLQTCADNMTKYVNDVVEATLRFMKYDPTLVEDTEDDPMEDDEFEAEEDFEEDTGFADEDDLSWKVRRGSVRVLHALVVTSPSDRQLYNEVVPALLARFKEREESVRDEVIATLTTIVSKAGSSIEQTPTSRKRRRGGSDAYITDAQHALINGYTSPSTPPPSDDLLGQLSSEIIIAASSLLKRSTPSTKLAIISLLRQLVKAQRGGLPADQVVDSVLATLDSDSSNALRIETVTLLQAVAESQSGKALQPHLAKIVTTLIELARDRYARTASEAFLAIESYIKAFTPPRSAAARSENGQYLLQFQAVILERLQDAETEVKEKAIHALGLLVGRTSGPTGNKLLEQSTRLESQQVLLDRMRNELTRLAAVRAFDTIAVLTQSKNDISPPLINEVVLELGAQLRKSSRSLRGASLSTLRALSVNDVTRTCLDNETVSPLVDLLLPLIQGEDLHMLGPALVILSVLAKDKPQVVATDAVNDALTRIAASSLTGSSLEALVECVTSIGQASGGAPLMKLLLAQGVSGNINVLGRVIGALLVASGPNSPVKLQDFTKELNSQADVDRQCLALSVLGEAGLRLGSAFSMQPGDLIHFFSHPSEKVKLSTAVALGRAGAGNVKLFLPQIINAVAGDQQYLALHSVKELLQHSNAEDEVRPLAQNLWERIISSGQTEDNKIVSAECIGRLTIIDPIAYLPQLERFLAEPNATTRGMVMIALRYVFSDTDDTYDTYLKDTILPMMSTMLGDTDLDNERLALSAFNSAFQNKSSLIVPYLNQLLPSILESTQIRADLVREVSMGPFKHKVDDGLEIRKSAYETMYVLLEQPQARQQIDVTALYDRVVAGIADEHEIKIVSCLILSRLISLAKEESTRRLDNLIQAFRAVLSFKPKDNAVKQELEKLTEHNKAIVRVSLQLSKTIATNDNRAWRDYFEWVKRDFQPLVKAAEDESKAAVL